MSEVFTREIARNQRKFDRLEGEIAGTEVLKLNEHAFAHVCSMYQALPGLRAFWPMSSVAYTNPQALDISANGNHLTNNNIAFFGNDSLVPYVEFNGTTRYLSRPDGGAANWADIRGNELYIDSVAQKKGVTIGGWWKVDDAIPAAIETLIGKWGAAFANQAYRLSRETVAGHVIFSISDAGVNHTIELASSVTTADWHFIVGRFMIYYTGALSEVKVWLDGEAASATYAPTIIIKDVGTEFTIAARSGPAEYYDGKASLCFLCAMALADDTITALYQQSRAMFGV